MRHRLLDLTRSLRRASRMATGIDRVEHAYLNAILAEQDPAFGVVRTRYGYLLLDRAGLKTVLDRVDGRVSWNDPEQDMRSVAVARCLPWGLGRMLKRHLPSHFDYFNVGHSNLTARVMKAVQHAKGRIHVLVHDVIPLEYPDYQRPETVEPFRAKLRQVALCADRVIYNSHDTQMRSERLMLNWGQCPQGIVAHLGTIVAQPNPDALALGLPPKVPYFVAIGTIEPRKNHAFLLDVWEELGPNAPPLLICGGRGWNNQAVFDRLDALPLDHPVQELSGLSDGAMSALLENAAGLLFPSHAEGYGLPPAEAAALGTRVLCNDLPVLREFLNDIPVYASVKERYLWIKKINEWAQTPGQRQQDKRFTPPTWVDHFKITLR